MNNLKSFKTLVIFFFIISCSFGVGGGWNNISEELEVAKARKNSKIIFSTKKKFENEVKNSKEIYLKKPLLTQNWIEKNYSSTNLVPHFKYKGKKELIFKSKKIGKNNFDIINADTEPLIENNNIFFYDPSGSIFKYSIKNKIVEWKFNFYKNRYKNKPKELNLAISNKNLLISDNLGYVYSLNKKTGNINWANNYSVPFRSNIKTDGDNIFLINQDNKFYVISDKNGEQKLDLETFPSFLKTNSKNNIVLDKLNNNLYFVTSAAEIYSINYKNRNINWLFNLTSASTEQKVDLFFSSPIIFNNNEIILSSALSTFSMNPSNGLLNWETPLSTSILPIVLSKNIVMVSTNGFLVNIDRQTGKVIWSRNILNKLKKLTFEKTGEPISILLLSNKIFITTEKGYFIFLNYQNGEILNYTKVSKGFFSKPVISNGNIFILDNKMRILKFN